MTFTKIIDVTHKDFKTIKKSYNTNITEKLKDGMLVITNPTFDDVDKLVVVDLAETDCKKIAKAVSGADSYVVEVKNHNNELATQIRLASDDSGLYKTDKPAKIIEIKDSDGNDIKPNGVNGVLLARRLGNMAPNVLTPLHYKWLLTEEFANDPKVKVTTIDKRSLERQGFNTLLSVAQGSANEPAVVVLEYKGNPSSSDIHVALVGKGLTFDSGGISLKPGAKMHEMKFDMCGSAAVVGAMRNIVDADEKVNVVAVVGLVENMPGGNATRPGDVVTTKKGLTVENWNTDAEGRLVLCDLLTYVQEEYPTVNKIVDVATLTGAILVALGDEYAGLFTNSTDFGDAIADSGEQYWRMPMGKVFAKQLDGVVADLKNIGNGHPGSTTAAEFLYKFINEGVSWAHLDIAGTAWKDGKATGFGVESLHTIVREYADREFPLDDDMGYNY